MRWKHDDTLEMSVMYITEKNSCFLNIQGISKVHGKMELDVYCGAEF